MQEHRIKRQKTKQIWVGNVAIGGDAPISIQTMTNTETTDVRDTVNQIARIKKAGADMVRISVPDMESSKAFGQIKQHFQHFPIIADIHFDYRIALDVADRGADCLRINPGNIGSPDRIKSVVDKAIEKNIPIRIGVNAGSLEKEILKKYSEPCASALVDSAKKNIELLEQQHFQNYKISIKASDVFMAVEAYRQVSQITQNPIHLGITESGGIRNGAVRSSIGLGLLLWEGIGDTLRVSLAADPVEEVKVGWDILKSLKLRSRGVNLIACPSCSRQNFDVIATVNELEQRIEDIDTPIKVAIIGCVVNGPGEAKVADLGFTGGTPNNILYIDGKINQKIAQGNLVDQLESQIRLKAKELKEKLITTS